MRVAVPEHQGRIAPVFDCCRRILIVVQGPEADEQVAEHDWSAVPRMARPARLQEQVVDLLVCGGISCVLEDQIRRSGILVIPWVAGAVSDVMAALRQGRINDPCWLMPGRGRCRMRNRPDGPVEMETQTGKRCKKGA
ncbi:MAG: hypothetical protein V2B18_12050 [Pseudomonadota bacterium]